MQECKRYIAQYEYTNNANDMLCMCIRMQLYETKRQENLDEHIFFQKAIVQITVTT